VQAARLRFAAIGAEWGAKRAELLYAVADEIHRRFDEFLEAEVADTGKPVAACPPPSIFRGSGDFKGVC